ncbi:condensation domain-containing protein, partial [Pseudoalteromonas ruthenica]|uniref:condensation domain-containing protein n=1 Tax=Pseudoalteromonas ruthenica TaxID=151081 RepID=UPI003D28D133
MNDCLNDIIRRHDIFRTVYLNDGDEPYQSVLEHDVFTMSEIDLSTLAPEQQEVQLAQLKQQEALCPFSLST